MQITVFLCYCAITTLLLLLLLLLLPLLLLQLLLHEEEDDDGSHCYDCAQNCQCSVFSFASFVGGSSNSLVCPAAAQFSRLLVTPQRSHAKETTLCRFLLTSLTSIKSKALSRQSVFPGCSCCRRFFPQVNALLPLQYD